jgi:ubiquitin-conjugating enzyme E2 J2
MKPPRVKMLTPSGRFEINKRICLSMSDYHAESWNPSWTVEKILVGMMSFMYEESTESIGSLLDSWKNREKMAKDSELFNMQNETYVQLFGGGEENDGEDGAGDDGDAPQGKGTAKPKTALQNAIEEDDGLEDDEDVCRFCLCPASQHSPLVLQNL